MLTYGTQTQTVMDGRTCNLENLSIGQFVYDPISKKFDEIIDILAQKVSVETGREPLAPIRAQKGLLNTEIPSRDLIVSRGQPVMMVRRENPSDLPEVRIVSASDIRGVQPFPSGEITYAAIFFETKQPILANGALCMGYTDAIYTQ